MTILTIFTIGFLVVLLLGALSAAAQEHNTRIWRELQIGALREVLTGTQSAPQPATEDGASPVTALVVIGAIATLLWLVANIKF